MNAPDFIRSVDWKQLGLRALQLTLRHGGELLIRGGQFERHCGQVLQELSTRIQTKPRP